LVNFLLLVENISKYSKVDIDKGLTPSDVYNLCSCIRETFCMSYSIRKINKLYIYLRNQKKLIKFDGKRLRYLGPDERSQALLFEKALNKINIINKWSKSTPGIFVRKYESDNSFLKYMISVSADKNIFIIDELSNMDVSVNNFLFLEDLFVIIPAISISSEIEKLSEKFKEMKNIKTISLSKIKGVENKILFINFRSDSQI
jgi:tRNA pseudouridine-54 N-methylase